MTIKQNAVSLIIRVLLSAGLLWGAWYECGPFTWTILCLLTASIEFRILAAWLERKNNELDSATKALGETLLELRKKNDLIKGANNGPHY